MNTCSCCHLHTHICKFFVKKCTETSWFSVHMHNSYVNVSASVLGSVSGDNQRPVCDFSTSAVGQLLRAQHLLTAILRSRDREIANISLPFRSFDQNSLTSSTDEFYSVRTELYLKLKETEYIYK